MPSFCLLRLDEVRRRTLWWSCPEQRSSAIVCHRLDCWCGIVAASCRNGAVVVVVVVICPGFWYRYLVVEDGVVWSLRFTSPPCAFNNACPDVWDFTAKALELATQWHRLSALAIRIPAPPCTHWHSLSQPRFLHFQRSLGLLCCRRR